MTPEDERALGSIVQTAEALIHHLENMDPEYRDVCVRVVRKVILVAEQHYHEEDYK